jgi:acetolactate synthase I/III small subunit
MRHILAILVENRFGELARIVGLFSSRGYNIESLTVAETLEPRISHVTLVTNGDDATVEQIVKQLDKQIRVLSVRNLAVMEHIEREMALVHVNAGAGDARLEVMRLAGCFEARVIDLSENAVTVEAVGESYKVNALLRSVEPFGIREVARAGVLAIRRLSTLVDGVDENTTDVSWLVE